MKSPGHIERHGPISVRDNWLRNRDGSTRHYLTVDHVKPCPCDGYCIDGCDGTYADEDCQCVTCEALAVKHELMLAEDAAPEAIALLEKWAAELVQRTLEVAEVVNG